MRVVFVSFTANTYTDSDGTIWTKIHALDNKGRLWWKLPLADSWTLIESPEEPS